MDNFPPFSKRVELDHKQTGDMGGGASGVANIYGTCHVIPAQAGIQFVCSGCRVKPGMTTGHSCSGAISPENLATPGASIIRESVVTFVFLRLYWLNYLRNKCKFVIFRDRFCILLEMKLSGVAEL
jgi:hypothetical protein